MKKLWAVWGAAVLILALAGPALADPDETLMIIVPRASGTTPVAGRFTLNSNHYSLHAYPGVEYRVRTAARGGVWPYTYSIQAGPAGLVVNSSTGLITWPSPTTTGSPHNATVRVTDALGATVDSSWTITVATSKFVFLDCDVAGPGTGTIGDPYKQIADLYNARSAHANKIVYFRDCTPAYNLLNMALNSSDRKDFHGNFDPMQWLAYPGDPRPVIDIGFQSGVSQGIFFRFQAGPAALIGFECANARNKCINTVDGMSYVTVNDNLFSSQCGTNGENPGYWQMELGNGSDFGMFMNNEATNFGATAGTCNAGTALKAYAQKYMLIADNYIHDSVGTSNIQGIDLKGSLIDQPWVHNNHVANVYAHAIGGSNFTLANGMFQYNRIYGCGSGSSCFVQNEAGVITTGTKVRRNTVVGRWDIANVAANSGPFILENNVHISTSPNDDGLGACAPGQRIVCPPDNAGADETRIQVAASPNENLVRTPSDNCVGATGALTDGGPDNCRTTYLGLKGYETTGSPPPPSPPNPPTGLTVVDTPSDAGGSLDLTWTVSISSGVTEQRVKRSEVSGSGYALVTTFSNNTTAAYTDTNAGGGLVNGTRYYYVIEAYNGTTTLSATSTEASGVPQDNQVPPLFQSGGSAGGSAF